MKNNVLYYPFILLMVVVISFPVFSEELIETHQVKNELSQEEYKSEFKKYVSYVMKEIQSRWLDRYIRVYEKGDFIVDTSFNVDVDGMIVDVEIIQPSGNESFDNQVLKFLNESKPFNQIPKTLAVDFLPIRYKFLFESGGFKQIEKKNTAENDVDDIQEYTSKEMNDKYVFQSGAINDYMKKVRDIIGDEYDPPHIKLIGSKNSYAYTSFTINKDGKVSDVFIQESSGDEKFDLYAKKFIGELNFPELPADYTEPDLKTNIELKYKEKSKIIPIPIPIFLPF